MERDIATGRINIDLNDAEAIAGLRKVDAEFNRLMRDVERSKASAELDADIKPLEAKIEKAKRGLKKLEGERASVEVGADTEELDRKIMEVNRRIKILDGKRAQVQIDVDGDKQAIARMKAVEKAQEHLTKAVEDSEKRTQKAVNQSARVRSSLHKQQMGEMRAAEAEAHRINSSIERERDAAVKAEQTRVNKMAQFSKAMEQQRARELSSAERSAYQLQAQRDELPKLEKAYASLTREVERLEKAQMKAGKGKDQRLMFHLDIDRRIATQELDKVRNELRDRLGHNPIEVPLAFPRANALGARVKREMDQFQRPFLLSAAGIGYRAGGDMADAIGRGLHAKLGKGNRKDALVDLGSFLKGGSRNIVAGIGSKLGDFGSKLADMTVRLGPFTATIRAAVVGMSVLGPVILDVVGALGALVAVTGSGLVGAMGIGTAAVGAFGLVLGSTALILPQLLGGYKELSTLQTAFHKAVDQYGAGSKEATKALDKYKSALDNVSPSARSAFKGFQELKTGIKSLSKDSQKSFDDTLNEGVKTGNSLLKALGPNMTKSFDLVAKGAQTFFKALRSPEAVKDFKSLFKDGQDALPAFGMGLANIGRAMANVAVAFGHALPGMGKGFETWTKGILTFTQNGPKMTKLVDSTVNSLRNLGHFLQAGSRLLITFFGGGVAAGNSFVVTMTKAMDRWTAFLQTTEGHQKLGDFFSSGVSGLQAFYGAIAPIIQSFVAWSAAIAPVSRGIFLVVGAVSKLVGSLLSITALQSPLTALGATLGVLWGLGKIRAATGAVTAFGAALKGVAVQQEAVAVSGAASKAGGALGAFGSRNVPKAGAPMIIPAGGIAAAEKEAVALTRMGRAGAIAKGGLSGLGAITTGVASVTAGLAVAAVAAGAGLYLYETRTRSWEKANQAADKSRRAMYAGLAQLPGVTDQAAQAQLGLQQSQLGLVQSGKAVKDINKQIKAEQDKAKPSIKALNDLYGQRKQASLDLRQAQLSESIATEQNVAAQKALTTTARQAFTASQANYANRNNALNQRGGQSAGSLIVGDPNNTMGLQNAKNMADAYSKISHNANEAGVSVKQYIAQNASLANNKDLQKYVQQIDQVDNAAKAMRVAYDNLALSQANQARITAGQIPLNEKAARSIGELTRLGGKSLTTKVTTKFDDPGKAAQVGKAAAAALKSGAGRGAVLQVIADTKGVENTLLKLKNIKLGAKRLEVVEDGGTKAVQTLEKLAGRKLTAKEFKIAQHGGLEALKLLDRIAASHPKPAVDVRDQASGKLKTIINALQGVGAQHPTPSVSVAGDALGTLHSIINTLQGLNGKTATTYVRTISSSTSSTKGGAHNQPGGADGGMFAGGGATQPNERQQARAAQTAMLSGSPNKAVSQKITRPQYLVGEEARPEFVIATNPAYRDRNLRYLAMAAAALGTTVVQGGVTAAADGLGSFDGAAFNPSNVLGRKASAKKSKKPPKKAGKLTKARGSVSRRFNQERPWTKRVEFLTEQKSQWEREVSIRESQIKQPNDMLVEVSKTKVEDPSTAKTEKDPVTGVVTPIPGTAKKVDVPVYGPNPDIGPYQQQIAAVLAAMDTLMSFTRELVKAIPSAITADNSEIKSRNALDAQLAHAIGAKKSESITKIDPKTKKRVVDEHKQRVRDHAVAKLEDERTKNDDVRKGLRDDVKTLTEQRRDVGFDYREQEIARADRQRESDQASTDPNVKGNLYEQSAKANADGVKEVTSRELDSENSGSGSSGQSQSDYNDSVAAANLQKANDLASSAASDAKASSDALRAFGSTGDIGQAGFRNAITAGAIGGIAATLSAGATTLGPYGNPDYAAGSSVVSSGGADSAVNTRTGINSTGVSGTSGTSTGGVNLTINTLHPGDPQTLAAIASAATAGFAQQNPISSSTISVGL